MPRKKLNELIPSQHGKIVKVRGIGPLRQRMIDMGLISGAEIKVIRRAPLGDPVEYRVKGYNLSLRKREAEHILVDVNSSPLSTIDHSRPVRLVHICGGRHFRHRVKELNLQIGSMFHISQNFHHGPIIIKMGNHSIKVGQGMAQKILVETID